MAAMAAMTRAAEWRTRLLQNGVSYQLKLYMDQARTWARPG